MKEKSSTQNKSDSNIVDLILEDHKPLKELIKVLKDLKADASERLVAFEKFAPLLMSHAKPEEKSLYVFMKEHGDENLVVEGMEGDTEHALASQLIDEIFETEDENLWSAKVKVLAEMVDHHIKEEEDSMLPEFKGSSTPEERTALGKDYLRFKNQMTSNGALYKKFLNSDSIQAH